MARSNPSKSAKAVVAKTEDAPLTTKVSSGTPYQLDPAQVEKAATALVSHMRQHAKEKSEKGGKQSLAADEDEEATGEQVIFLSVSTKQHVHDTSRLKPAKLYDLAPHSIRPKTNSMQSPSTPIPPQRRPDMHLHQRPATRLQRPRSLRRLPRSPSLKGRPRNRPRQAQEEVEVVRSKAPTPR
jgi:hypothetical protein